jgi:hypothetical protein
MLLEQWASFVVASIGEPRPSVRPKRVTGVLHVTTLNAVRAWRVLKILYEAPGPALLRKREAALSLVRDYRPPRRTHGSDGRFIWTSTYPE